MRLLSCKIHCPFICFCKPSSTHIYTSGPLKLQNGPQLPSPPVPVSNGSDQSSSSSAAAETASAKTVMVDSCLKSSLKKAPSEPNGQKKKQVQWTDFSGQELVEVREYESSEVDETDREEDGSRSCVCVIL